MISWKLHLQKRFCIGSKINKKILINENLNLSKFSSRKNDTQKYILRAVILHTGPTTGRGHYVTISRNEEQWIKYDDHTIKTVKKSYFQRKSTPYVIILKLTLIIFEHLTNCPD